MRSSFVFLLSFSPIFFVFSFFLGGGGGGGAEEGGGLVISYRANLANDNSKESNQSWLTETSGRDPTMPSSYCCPGRSVNTGRQYLGCPVVKKETETSLVCESIWPNGKGLGWWAEGPRFDSVSALLSLQNLWSVDTVLWLCPSQLMKH